MPFPTGWPPRPASGRRSVRVFITGTTASNYHENAYLFSQLTGAVTIDPTIFVETGERGQTALSSFEKGATPLGGGRNPHDAVQTFQNISPPLGDQAPPIPMAWIQTLKIRNQGGAGEDLDFTFDGVNQQGFVGGGEISFYRNRFEAGIAVRIDGDEATGSITTVPVASLIDGETVVIDDGSPASPHTFEFDDDDSVVETATLRKVDLTGLVTDDDVRDALIQAINNTPDFGITASDGGAATVDLLGGTGAAANVAITDTVANVGFTTTGMAGGTGTAVTFVIEGW